LLRRTAGKLAPAFSHDSINYLVIKAYFFPKCTIFRKYIAHTILRPKRNFGGQLDKTEIHKHINGQLDRLEQLIAFQAEQIRQLEADRAQLMRAHDALLAKCIDLEARLRAR
jgi:hypothetical protein